MFFHVLRDAASSAATSAAESAKESAAAKTGTNYTIWIILGVLIVFFVVNYFFSRKRNKKLAEEQEKKSAIKPGYTVTTIGGVIGEVVEVDEEENSFVLKTGSGENCSYMKFDKQAIYTSKAPAGEEPAAEGAEDPFNHGETAEEENNGTEETGSSENEPEEKTEETETTGEENGDAADKTE